MVFARLILVLAIILAANAVGAPGPSAAAPARLSGEAHTLAVGSPSSPVVGAAQVILPPGGGTETSSVSGRGVGAGGSVSFLDEQAATSTGALAGDSGWVTSTAQVEFVELFAGLIRASGVKSTASVGLTGDRGGPSGGATFANLTVAGLGYSSPLPNERVDLPGVGYVILNEQLTGGDGRNTTSMVVRAIHLHLTAAALDLPAGTEIIVANAAAGIPDLNANNPVRGGQRASSGAVTGYAPISTRAPLDLSFNDNGGGGNDNLDFDNGNGNGNDNGPTPTPVPSPTATRPTSTPIQIVITVIVVQPTATSTPSGAAKPSTSGR
ncbi:MAG: choice-of-anchor P family protein [Chloroflexota bacterium]